LVKLLTKEAGKLLFFYKNELITQKVLTKKMSVDIYVLVRQVNGRRVLFVNYLFFGSICINIKKLKYITKEGDENAEQNQ